MTFVATFEPKPLWGHFDEILTIPRGSKEEEKARQYVIEVAERHGFSHQSDATGNIVVRKPGAKGYENAPVTILQSHLDMVNEKNSDVDHDFSKDPIQPRQDGEFLTASGTTLGSDNGIGVAAMLAILEADDLVHGPLELLFTVDEETGLNGAAGLDASLLEGRRLINLDSEEEGSLCVGCAGGADSTVTLPLTSMPTPDGAVGVSVKLHGLKGGHSGIDIRLQRGNATKLLARALYAASIDQEFHLASLEGGNKHNAIPREASATVAISADGKQALIETLTSEIEAIQEEFKPVEPDMGVEIEEVAAPGEVWDAATADKVLELIEALPHGIVSMSYAIPDLVETSTNFATVNVDDGKLRILLSSRSSVASAMNALKLKIRATASLAGAEVSEEDGYPGWEPDLDSELLKLLKEIHKDKTSVAPKIEAVHAGLECALVGKKIPGMDMISIGPNIEFPHSPDERVKIDSVATFWELLTATLEKLATPA
jgi:dipeptidase D